MGKILDLKSVKVLALKFSVEELKRLAAELESKQIAKGPKKDELGTVMSDFLQAIELRLLIEEGKTIEEAIEEFRARFTE